MSNQYKSGDMLSVEEALEQILDLAQTLDSQNVDMLEAAGRVLAQDIVSDIDIAPFDNSGMDGFAVKAGDTQNASPEHPTRLEVIGEIAAGEVFEGELQSGEALRIMTGAPVPEGSDTVVQIEAVEVLGESPEKPAGTEVLISNPLKLGKNVRPKAEDAKAGEVLMRAGTVLHSAGVGMLASTGNTTVQVIRRPRVAILSTGDELVDPSQKPGPGQIRNSNCFSLAAAVQAAGAVPDIIGIVKDDFDAIVCTLKAAVADHDMVLISGGAAEGDFDYTFKVIKELGQVFFSKVNMRPGKAQTLGLIDKTIVFGLPGNPAAAMVGFEVLLRPVLRKMQGYKKIMRPVTRARLSTDANKPDKRRFYIRARLQHNIENNEYWVTPEANQSSALLSALQNSNCLVVLPEGLIGNAAGETVACLRLDIDEGVVI